MMNTAPILQEISQQLRPDARIWVAYSGGLDSTVLLHILSQSSLVPHVRAIHINHQLSEMADDWEHHCIVTAHAFGVPCDIEKVDIINAGRGVEHAAREARYSAFEKTLAKGDIILFAHHCADLAETVLFRLMRGAGLKGLAGMQAKRRLGQGELFRPLLNESRLDLLDYAQTHLLHWVEDDSNQNTDFDRNFLRHHIFPKLQERWPDAKQKIARSSQWLDEADGLLSEYAEEDLSACSREKARFGERIALEIFSQYSKQRQKNIVRFWCDQLGHTLPDAAQLEQIDTVLLAKEDAQPCLAWGRCELRRYQNHLYLVSAVSNTLTQETIQCRPNESITLPDGSNLTVECDALEGRMFTVRFRSEGLRCQPKGRDHSQTLKKLLQEYRVEPWLRDRVPLVYCGEDLLGVGDVFLCEGDCAYDIGVRWE